MTPCETDAAKPSTTRSASNEDELKTFYAALNRSALDSPVEQPSTYPISFTTFGANARKPEEKEYEFG